MLLSRLIKCLSTSHSSKAFLYAAYGTVAGVCGFFVPDQSQVLRQAKQLRHGAGLLQQE